jgi:uroporphyrinogen-III synthase
VSNFFDMLDTGERKRLLDRALIASIGPVTSDAIRGYGRGPDVEAKSASIQALHGAIVDLVTSNKQPATV